MCRSASSITPSSFALFQWRVGPRLSGSFAVVDSEGAYPPLENHRCKSSDPQTPRDVKRAWFFCTFIEKREIALPLGGTPRPRPRRAAHCRAIDFVQPELRSESIEPFVVVDKRPMEVAVDRNAARFDARDRGDVVFDVLRALCVVRVGETVLGDDDRESALRRVAQQRVERVGNDFPTVVGESRAGAIEILKFAGEPLASGTSQVKSRIEVRAEDVERFRQIVAAPSYTRRRRKDEVPASGSERLDERSEEHTSELPSHSFISYA